MKNVGYCCLTIYMHMINNTITQSFYFVHKMNRKSENLFYQSEQFHIKRLKNSTTISWISDLYICGGYLFCSSWAGIRAHASDRSSHIALHCALHARPLDDLAYTIIKLSVAGCKRLHIRK